MSDTVRNECYMSTDGRHYFTFDSASGAKSTFCCSCGEILVEYEDSQP